MLSRVSSLSLHFPWCLCRSLVLLLLTTPVLRPKPPLPSGLAPVALFFLVPPCPITHYAVLSLADRGAETLTAQPLSACLCFLACCCHRFPGEVTFGSVTHCQAASHIICLQHGCTDTSSKATLLKKAQHEGALTPSCIVWKNRIISWLQSASAMILETKKIKSLTVSIVSSSICMK